MWVRAALAGLALGVLAYAADFCHGLLAVAMVLVSSSGLAWGAAALVLAFAAADRPVEATGAAGGPVEATGAAGRPIDAGGAADRPVEAAGAADRPGGRGAAIGAAVTVLAVATLVYYGVIVADGDRWHGGVLEDGTPADAMALRSILVATVFWLAASVAGGVVLGLLGHAIRRSRPRAAALAAGAAAALLAGQGALRLGQAGGHGPQHLTQLAPWLIETAAEVALAVALGVALLLRGARPQQWGWFTAATAALLVVALLAWSLVETVRATGF